MYTEAASSTTFRTPPAKSKKLPSQESLKFGCYLYLSFCVLDLHVETLVHVLLLDHSTRVDCCFW